MSGLGRLGIGCATVVAVVVLLVVGGYLWWRWDEPRGRLPDHIRVAELIASRSLPDLLEGCFYGLYRLEPTTVAALRQRGLTFLGHDTHTRKEHPGNPYGPWHETPLVVHEENGAEADGDGPVERLDALSASGQCYTGVPPFDRVTLPPDLAGFSVEQSLMEPGSFYAVTKNGEGMMLLDPSAGVGVVLYYG